jgi:hypothetical protein
MIGEDTYDITADALLVDGECFHGELHPVEAGRFPNEIGGKIVRAV